MSSLGGFSQTWFAEEGATTAVSALLLALPVGAAFFLAAGAGLAFSFLAASATGLRIKTIAGTEHRTADNRTNRVCVNVMGNLSKAKVSPGSRVSAGYRSRGWMSQ
jgi:cytolysin (calcineurin-like family phosphatase)